MYLSFRSLILRMKHEEQSLLTLKEQGMKIYYPDEEDRFRLRVGFFGPEGTPYAGGWFVLEAEHDRIKMPFSPPRIKFLTPIYHPNISEEGEVSLKIIQDYWLPVQMISKPIQAVISLLNDFNLDEPINVEAGFLCKSDFTKFEEVAREYTLTHCSNF